MPTTDVSPDAKVGSQRRLSGGELVVYALIALVSAIVILQRTGSLARLMGESSAYDKFESAVFGKPSVNTVRGVEQFLEQLGSDANADPK